MNKFGRLKAGGAGALPRLAKPGVVMKRRKRNCGIVSAILARISRLPLGLPLLLPVLLNPLLASVPAAHGCFLNSLNATPSALVEIQVTFKTSAGGGGGVADGDPDPMLTRRFVNDREYAIRVRSSRLSIVRFAVGLLPHRVAAGGSGRDVGRLLFSSQSPGDKRDEKCVAAFQCMISCRTRPEVELAWTAQSTDGAACVEARALVTLEYDETTWLRASLYLCQATRSGEQVNRFPAAPCCACGSANYLMKFQGAWDPETEPVAASPDRLVWSELLGTSHDETFAPWEFGGYPNGGVKQLCDSGFSGTLEDEIKHFGNSGVLTVIKARDLRQTRLPTDQSRSAILTVNATHHLVSFLTRPASSSPGWCVGLPLLDLCRDNCTWAESLQAELRPWFAGDTRSRIDFVRHVTRTANRTLATVSLQRIPPRLSGAGSDCG